jgi:mycothiol synthase
MTKQTYYKRYRMELDLKLPRPRPSLPEGFEWASWSAGVLESHAQVKFRCFAAEIDAIVFPSLSHLSGCRDLMVSIAARPGFCPAATWLIREGNDFVGTVQGVFDPAGFGGIQNLGVVPECRGLGLGPALLLKALEGFAAAGAKRAFLEVTARNDQAVRMYRRIGFRCYKSIYRVVNVRAAEPAACAVDPVGVGL